MDCRVHAAVWPEITDWIGVRPNGLDFPVRRPFFLGASVGKEPPGRGSTLFRAIPIKRACRCVSVPARVWVRRFYTALRAASAMPIIAVPPNSRLMPTSRPRAQVAVSGSPANMIPARMRSTMPLASIQPQRPESCAR
jgi:hypothetical protein